MDRKKLLKPLVYLMFSIFIANSLALKFYWYSSIWYFDMPMHFFGGLWVGMFFIWFFSIKDLPFFNLSLDTFDYKLIYKTISFVLIMGVLWEFYEFFVYNQIGHDPFNLLDTVSDVFFDLAGASFALLYSFRKITPITGSKVDGLPYSNGAQTLSK